MLKLPQAIITIQPETTSREVELVSSMISWLTVCSVEVVYSTATLTNKLKNVLCELNRNNIVRYSAILQHLANKGYKLGCVVCIIHIHHTLMFKYLRQTKLLQYLKETGVATSQTKLIHPNDQQQLVLNEIAADPEQT